MILTITSQPNTSIAGSPTTMNVDAAVSSPRKESKKVNTSPARPTSRTAQPSPIACSGQGVVQPQDVPPIWVTGPKIGYTPNPESNNSKIHTFNLTDICCDELNTPSQSELSTVGSPSYVDVAATIPSECLGQGATHPQHHNETPDQQTKGIKIPSASETGSVYMEGKRRSARANFSYTADGNATADEMVLANAKRWVAA